MANLPNEDREKRVIATGPNQGFTVRGLTGFYTDADKLDYGVNVQGHECGVYGESVDTPTPTNRKTIEDGTGVCGVGDNYGVFGKGITTAGVHGENEASGTGVFGVALDVGAIGVAGISQVKKRRSKKKAQGIGIVGATESGQGYGVVGLSVDSLTLTGPTSVPRPRLNDRTGMPEIGGVGSGIGVFGGSGTGTGVYGQSSTGRGGTFEATQLAAQVRLVPAEQETLTPQLPKNGKVGDMLMIRNTAKNVDGKTEDKCSLWLCIPEPGQPDRDDSNLWREVLLGQFVTGFY